MTNDEAIQLFWSRVDIDDSDPSTCWMWTGPGVTTASGHVRISFRGQRWYAHRLAWTLAVGPLKPGAIVRHAVCRPPTADAQPGAKTARCCRAGHLSPYGGALANARDRDAAGARTPQLPVGADFWTSKLSWEQADDIRAARQAGVSTAALALRYGVSTTTIRHLVNGKTYRRRP